MESEGRDRRKRCAECGRKYVPASSARKHQEACSRKCRLKRRAGQARDRYYANVEASRRATRNRKRKLRGGLGGGPEPPGCDFPAEVEVAIRDEMESLPGDGWLGRDQVERTLRRVARRAMSLAGLEENACAAPGG
jgi:hypothetical protein